MGGLMRVREFAAVMAVQAATVAAAQPRVFESMEAASPGGTFRLEAARGKGPNGEPAYTYVLTKVEGGAKVWERGQDEGWPLSVPVSDSGWVAAMVTPASLIVLEPGAGKKTLEADILGRFSAEERREHAQTRTGGVAWLEGSLPYFVREAGREHFVLRTGWGLRVIADLETGRLLEEPAAEFLERLKARELAGAKAIVEEAAKRVKEYPVEFGWARVPEGLPPPGRVLAAIRIIAERGDAESVPALRVLEKSEYLANPGGLPGRGFEDGEINPFYRGELIFRMAARYALRHLGEEPADVAVNGFWEVRNGGIDEGVPVYRIKGVREELVEQLSPGMMPGEILRLIGTPEYVDIAGRAWEYDIDGADPHTLKIFFNRKGKELARTERVDAAWKDGRRQKQIFDTPR
jgi:hypothetical protein